MIKQYQGSGITTYTFRSGTEVTLSEEDFEEMLGFKDEMDRLEYTNNILTVKSRGIMDEAYRLEKKVKKLKKKLKGKLL